MAEVARGGEKTLDAFVRDGNGVPQDPEELTLSIFDNTASLVAGPFDIDDFVHVSTGHYRYVWTVPALEPLGTHTADYGGLLDGAALDGSEEFTVVAAGSIATTTGFDRLYMTPRRYRATKRVPADLTDLHLVEIAGDASAAADAYCNVPMLPIPFTFLGGEIINEQHIFRYPVDDFSFGTRRLFPKHQPVTSIQSLTLLVDPTAGTTNIDPSHVVINNGSGFIEIGSILSAHGGPFGISAFLFPMSGLLHPLAYLSYTYGQLEEVAGERLYPIGVTQEYMAQNGHWGPSWTIKVDGVTVSTGFSVDRAEGIVTFDADPAGVVTADYSYRLNRDVARATRHIMTHLIGQDSLERKGMVGSVESIRVAEIEISRGRSWATSRKGLVEDLAIDVPQAARLLNGHRFIAVG